jgi:hypothetical protein
MMCTVTVSRSRTASRTAAASPMRTPVQGLSGHATSRRWRCLPNTRRKVASRAILYPLVTQEPSDPCERGNDEPAAEVPHTVR